MKTNLSKMLRASLAMLLVACMVAGFVPTAVFAETANADAGEINYVSIGDSMANGYCFDGYKQGEAGIDFYNGVGVYGEDAYPEQFAEYLEGKGYTVDHTRLAVSALRAEDLYFLLGGREMTTDGWQNQVKGYTRVDNYEELAAFYQEAVTDADIITLGVGNASFGAYLLHRLTDALGVFNAELDEEETVTLEDALILLEDEEQKQMVMEAYDYLLSKLNAYVPAELAQEYSLETICGLMAYTVAGFVLNYKGSIERILELNPDVEIVLVGLMNTTYGMSITAEGMDPIPVGDMMDGFFGILNAYVAGLPAVMQGMGKAGEAEFYYAEQPNPLFISQQFAKLSEANWGVVDRLSGKIVRSRTITAYNDDLRGMIGSALGFALPKISLNDVENYQFDVNDKYNISVRFHQEIGVLMGGGAPGPLTTGYLAKYGNDGFANAQAYLTPEINKEISIAIYLALEEAVVECVDISDITLDGLMGIAGDIFGALGEMPDELDPANGPGPNTIKNALVGWFTGTDTAKAMVKIFAMFKVGNGMSVHPTPAGHDNIAKAVIAAYEGKYTAKDETIKNAKIVLEELYNLLQTYGPEVAAQVWAQWEEQGYVDAVKTSINDLIETAKARYTYYTETALPAIDAAVLELAAEKDALSAELVALNAQLAAKKAELAEVIGKQEIGSVDAPSINIDATLGGNVPTEVPENDCTVEGEGVEAELEAAIKDLEHAVAVIEALIADISADIADMVALAEQIGAAVAELAKTVEQIVAAAEDLYNAFEAVAEVLKNSDGLVDATISAFEAARSTALAAADVLELVAGTAGDMIADVEAMANKLAADGKALCDKIVADIPAAVAGAPDEVKAAIAISMLAAKKVAEVGEDHLETYLPGIIAEATAEYNEAKAKLEAHVVEKNAEVEAILAEIDAYIAENYPAAEAAVKAEYEATVAALEAKKAELAAELLVLNAQLEAKVTELENEAEETIEAAIAPIKAQIARVEGDLATVEADLACAAEHLGAAVEAAYNEVVAQAKALYEEKLVAANAELKAAVEAVEAFLADVSSETLNEIVAIVEQMKKDLVELGKDTLEALAEMAVAAIEDLLRVATTADLVIDDEFKYVALGDGSAAAESYVEKLASLYNEEAKANGVEEISFVNTAAAGNTVASVRADLPADVADADLITIGFSNVSFLANAISGADRDWAALVGEENVPYVEQLLAEVAVKIAETGLTGDAAEMANSIIEGFAYSAVEYAVELPKLISDIAAINPDAVIVIVGMYNPLEGTSIVIEGATIEISEYVDYLVAGVDVHGLAYSLLSGDSIYVGVEDVATINTDTELGMTELIGLIGSGFEALNPSAAGDETIMVALANALNVTYVPAEEEPEYTLGDADNDGVVTLLDAQTIMQNYVGEEVAINLGVCDLDGDGIVGLLDAQLIMQLYVGAIDKFPVEQ